jgi:Protein of unknown function (DUF3048).
MYFKKIINICLAFGCVICLDGCKPKQNVEEEDTPSPTPSEKTIDTSLPPNGTYFSETTGLPISKDLLNQRPIAAMIDCETIAMPHYGVAEADIVYDLMNNVMNGRITRFMAIYKDYANIPQIGSIRSTRTTNVWLAGEWNAILCHDGEAWYAIEHLNRDYAQQHLSGIFSRVDNGKPREFTEYIMAGDVTSAAESYGFDLDYNQYKQDGEHFSFVKYNTELDTGLFSTATAVQLPYPHNETSLTYNTETKSYDLSMYGELHKDAEDDQVLTFTNLLLLDSNFTEYPDGGYVYYNICGQTGNGYYLTNGKMEPITWQKEGADESITHYYDSNGNLLQMNRGKSYISYVPSDVWGDVVIQ